MGKLEVNVALVQKYNVPGPRYTSYPPATQFSPAITWDRLADYVRRNNETDRGLSLYFHLPFCHALCWFCGCTSIITKDQTQSAKYLEYLRKEMVLMAPMLNPRRRVEQLHFGGGSPSFLRPEEIRALGRMIRAQFQLADDVEAGIEIDPRGVTRDHVAAMREVGFNRASVGVQDYNPVVQKAVHRIQPRALTEQVTAWIRDEGFLSLNIDLIYGLPYQTVASFEQTLEAVLELRPERLVTFSYAHVPWLKPAQRILAKSLPSPEEKLQLLKLTIEKLTSEGYVYIGMDHFAREDDELAAAQRNKSLQRNFQGYSTHAGADIYAFGMSSISQTDWVYWQNHKELPHYYAALDQDRLPQIKGYVLTDDDKLRRQTIMRLMCDLSLDYAELTRRLGVDFARYFAPELNSMADLEADGLVRRNASGLEVTDLGRLLIRNIAMRFDAYLPKETERRFSKTI